jgi:hypothetical protein
LSHRPFNYMDTFTPCIFLAYFGDMFFSLFIIWGHSVAASCWTFCRGELLKLVWISVAKIWSRSLIPQENHTHGISGINLCNLGAELSILRCRKRFRGVNYVYKKKFFVANLGTFFWC